MSQDPHIRTDTSPEREAHLRILAGEGHNDLRDALALADEARRDRDVAAAEYKRVLDNNLELHQRIVALTNRVAVLEQATGEDE